MLGSSYTGAACGPYTLRMQNALVGACSVLQQYFLVNLPGPGVFNKNKLWVDLGIEACGHQ